MDIGTIIALLQKLLRIKEAYQLITKKKNVVVAIILLFVTISSLATVAAVAAPVTFLESVFNFVFQRKTYTAEELEEILSDAGLLYDLMKQEEYAEEAEKMLMIDKKTIMRILKAVDEYNKEVTKEYKVKYDYRVELGSLEELQNRPLDSLTGSIEKKDGLSGGKGAYSAFYYTDTVTLKRVAIDNEREGGGLYEDVFYMKWQPVVALCCMYIQANSENWGTYGWEEGKEHSYYLSDAEIDAIIDIFAYEYSYVRDITRSNHIMSMAFDSLLRDGSCAFLLSTATEPEGKGYKRTTRRIPCIAPAYIRNTYITYQYNYETKEDGSRELISRTYTANPKKLVDAFYGLVEDFSPQRYVYILGQLPMSETVSSYYKDIIFSEESLNGAIYTYTTTDRMQCPVIGAFVSAKKESWFNDGGDEDAAEIVLEGYYLPLYGIDGWGDRFLKPGNWIIRESESYGSFYVSPKAMESLAVSDSLSKEEIEYILKNYPFSEQILKNCPLFASKKSIEETAACLYAYQEDTKSSVCGLLGIMLQEGGFGSRIAVDGWNFFNISVGKSKYYSGMKEYPAFRDYRAIFEVKKGDYDTPAVNAFKEQVDWIYRNYWSKGQDSYYLMCFMGYDYENPDKAYESISHSYCPPWDDPAMPYARESYVIKDGVEIRYWKKAGLSNRGWINGCAYARQRFLEVIENK